MKEREQVLEELKEANQYIYSKLSKKNKTELIIEIEKDAEENGVPIITPEVAEYLKFTVRNGKFKNILEIGSATGYSGILMAQEVYESGGKLTTIEIDEERYLKACSNFEKSGLKNIKAVKGDAAEEIEKLNEEYDFVFIDAAKGQYMSFFEKAYKKTAEGGIIFIDNILFRGFLYKQDSPKKYRTIIKKLDLFIEELYSKYDFVLIPFGDGVGIVKK